MSEKEVSDVNERINKSRSADVPQIYFNGFALALGAGDIYLALELNGEPVARLNVSYTVSKTLVSKLNTVVTQLEKATGNEIMTTDYINEALFKDKKNDTPNKKS